VTNGDALPRDGLEVVGVTLRFGGFVVLNGLDLAVPRGELRCVIGPNGAGKTTLFNLICGVLTPDEGSIRFDGEDLTRLRPYRRARRGVMRKFQVPSVFADMTVLENLRLAAVGSDDALALAGIGGVDHQAAVDEALEKTQLTGFRKVRAGKLSHGQKQWLEIAMVVATRPKLMLLDEPTAGMTPAETHRTAELILSAADGLTTLVIEHDIKFLREIGEHVSVLHAGSLLVEGSFDMVEKDQRVRDVYLGKEHV
jgi:urea ABC transporter ATP-binding protein UrtD